MTNQVLAVNGVQVLTVVQESVQLVTVAAQGPAGPQGPQGLSGSSINSYLAAQNVSGHVAVVLDASGQCRAADAAQLSDHAVVGLTTGAAVAGDPVVVVGRGILEHSGWAFTIGAPAFLGLAGAITQTLPPSAVFSKVLGVAVSPTRISVDFQPAIFI